MTTPSTEQRLRWLQEAARVMSTGHAITADELLSDMVVSLGERGLAPIANKGNAYQLARWRMADWLRAQGGDGGAQEQWEAQQATSCEQMEQPKPITAPPPEVGTLEMWRARFERELSKPNAVVRLNDQRLRQLLRQHAVKVAAKDPEFGLALFELSCTKISPLQQKRPRRRSVRVLRQEMMLTQAQLAHRAGISLRTVINIERGMPCRMDSRRKVLRALGIPFSEWPKVFTPGRRVA